MLFWAEPFFSEKGGKIRGGGGGGWVGGPTLKEFLKEFCPVFIFSNIWPFPRHLRANPAPKIGCLGPSEKRRVSNKSVRFLRNGAFRTKASVF